MAEAAPPCGERVDGHRDERLAARVARHVAAAPVRSPTRALHRHAVPWQCEGRVARSRAERFVHVREVDRAAADRPAVPPQPAAHVADRLGRGVESVDPQPAVRRQQREVKRDVGAETHAVYHSAVGSEARLVQHPAAVLLLPGDALVRAPHDAAAVLNEAKMQA